MKITQASWREFVSKLSQVNKMAGDAVGSYIDKNGLTDTDALVTYSFYVAQYYGTAAASLAATIYDAVVDSERLHYPPAEMADSPTYGDVAKQVYGTLKHSQNPEELKGAVSRLVKLQGQDTLLQNGIRDQAEFAWIPSGDTCPFCIMLASNGWRPISKKALRNGHAEHIHANCDCTYMIRHSKDFEVEGYDPEVYRKMYDEAEGNTGEEKVNSMRRMFYAQNKGIVGAESSKAEEFIPGVNKNGKEIEFDFPVSEKERLNALRDEQKQIIISLSQAYNTNLETVTSGAKQAAGDVDVTGTIMRLSSKHLEDAVHEFAHTLAITDADKFGLTNNKDFWNEIRKVRTEYRKAVRDNPAKRISFYADAKNSLDEFMAEAFTQAIAKEKGIQLPDSYGSDLEYAEKVVQIINKYFKRK